MGRCGARVGGSVGCPSETLQAEAVHRQQGEQEATLTPVAVQQARLSSGACCTYEKLQNNT